MRLWRCRRRAARLGKAADDAAEAVDTRFGMSVVLTIVAPVTGEVSLVRSHSKMAVRS